VSVIVCLVTGIISHQTLTAVIYSLGFVLTKLSFVSALIIIYGPLLRLRFIVNTTPFLCAASYPVFLAVVLEYNPLMHIWTMKNAV
jgi:hypothetical protein